MEETQNTEIFQAVWSAFRKTTGPYVTMLIEAWRRLLILRNTHQKSCGGLFKAIFFHDVNKSALLHGLMCIYTLCLKQKEFCFCN